MERYCRSSGSSFLVEAFSMPPNNESLKRTLANANENHRDAVNEMGEQLKNLHSETIAEPLPEEMRKLLQKLDRRRRSSRQP